MHIYHLIQDLNFLAQFSRKSYAVCFPFKVFAPLDVSDNFIHWDLLWKTLETKQPYEPSRNLAIYIQIYNPPKKGRRLATTKQYKNSQQPNP
jgi:hypothetical protein